MSANLIRVRRAKWRTKPRRYDSPHNWVVVDPRLAYTREFVYKSHAAALRAADSLARHGFLRPKDLVGVNIKAPEATE